MSNIRINMENILSDENNKKRALKYVSKYNKNLSAEKNRKNLEKSASPLDRRNKQRDYNENTTPIPMRKILNITAKEPFYKINDNKINMLNNNSGNDLYFNKTNNNEECYDIEISSINENGMPQSKSPEPFKIKMIL